MSEITNEVVEDTTEEMDTELDTAIEDEVETTEEVDDTPDLDAQFLEKFEIQFDKQPKKFASIEELKEAAEMGSALPRYKEKLAAIENNPAYKYIDELMKSNGYSDPEAFVHAIKVNDKTAELVKKGMNEKDARAEAEAFVKNSAPLVDPMTKEIKSFVDWQNERVRRGVYDKALAADEVPKEVIEAYNNGEKLSDAYNDWYVKNLKLATEQETLKKVQSNKEKSAGKLPEGNQPKPQTMSIEAIDKKLQSLSGRARDKWIDANLDMIEKSGYLK